LACTDIFASFATNQASSFCKFIHFFVNDENEAPFFLEKIKLFFFHLPGRKKGRGRGGSGSSAGAPAEQ
jgi:hypothetical protein